MFVFKEITIEEVKTMAKWTYPFMEVMYMKPYFENHELGKELKGPLNCDGFAVYKDNQLFGLFEYYNTSEEIEIGLAISPMFQGKGYSQEYLKAGIDFLIKQYHYKYDEIVLHVEKENIPAVKAYLKFGFVITKEDEEIEMKYNVKERLS